MAAPINSLEWWDSYFEAQWEQNHGREQTRHFMSELLSYLPAREYKWISSASRTILDWGARWARGWTFSDPRFPAARSRGWTSRAPQSIRRGPRIRDSDYFGPRMDGSDRTTT